MKKVIVLLLVLNIAFSSAILSQKGKLCANSSDGKTMIELFYFSQKLDHFHLDDDQEWIQVRNLPTSLSCMMKDCNVNCKLQVATNLYPKRL